MKARLFRSLLAIYLLVMSSMQATHRPHSQPFVSGDSFRAIADHIFDETTPRFDASQVRAGDVIFINLSHQEAFFSQVHPKIREPYILISHNHDYSAPGKYRSFLDDEKLILWLTQNPDLVGHPKLVPIPIGLSNKHWNHSKAHDLKIAEMQKALRVRRPAKKYLLYVNFNVHTNPSVRQPVYEYFMRLPFCSWVANRPYPEYLFEMAQAKFVLSPHGGGLDCHRTWEALYVGSFPLVKTSTLDPIYQDLPVLIVQDWSEISPEFLEEKYAEMRMKTYNFDILYFDYWYKLIKKAQEPYKQPANKGEMQ